MAVGFPRTKDDIDQRAGQLAVNLRNVLTDIERFGELLALGSDAYFAGLGYTVEEVATLKQAYTDLYKVTRIYKGQAAQPSAYDFRTHAQHLMGVL